MAEERQPDAEGFDATVARPRRPNPDGNGPRSAEPEHGAQLGTKYIRVSRMQSGNFRRIRKNIFRATERAYEPTDGAERWWYRIRRFLIGRPLATEDAHHERLPKRMGLAVFASDALSSSAYAPEEILLVLVGGGVLALTLGVHVAAAVVVLLAIVAFSYVQTIKSYPAGGGTYIVTKDNLGPGASLVAASALMIGYILTVAVSVSAGVAAITSAAPALSEHKVALSVGSILLLTIANLRGVRESGSIFAAPTYIFVASMLATIGLAGFRYLIGDLTPTPYDPHAFDHATQEVGLFLILRAFTQGCSALTGTEAIADGVPAFKEPAARNAQITLALMAIILGVLFFGLTLVAAALQIIPVHGGETVVSQIARQVWGESPMYFVVQIATMLILILAANTAFVDFPRVNYFLARDDWMPHQFQYRGDRLAYTAGISLLAAISIGLTIGFNADVSALIPLYAIGVFIAFTCSQASMVRRWWTRREPSWQTSLPINIIGTITTGGVVLIAAITKFEQGAWVVVVLIAVLVFFMQGVHRHYRNVREELELPVEAAKWPAPREQVVLVPISDINRAAVDAIAYARSISTNVRAIHVDDDPDNIAALRDKWKQLIPDVDLIVLESPYRSLSAPLMAYIEDLDAEDQDLPVTVVLPEFVPRHWWEHILHNQSAQRLKLRLLFRPSTVVVSVPYHLHR